MKRSASGAHARAELRNAKRRLPRKATVLPTATPSIAPSAVEAWSQRIAASRTPTSTAVATAPTIRLGTAQERRDSPPRCGRIVALVDVTGRPGHGSSGCSHS